MYEKIKAELCAPALIISTSPNRTDNERKVLREEKYRQILPHLWRVIAKELAVEVFELMLKKNSNACVVDHDIIMVDGFSYSIYDLVPKETQKLCQEVYDTYHPMYTKSNWATALETVCRKLLPNIWRYLAHEFFLLVNNPDLINKPLIIAHEERDNNTFLLTITTRPPYVLPRNYDI